MIFHTRMRATAPDGTVTPFKGELVPGASSEPNRDNRDLVITTFKAIMPPSVDITAHDTLTVLGKKYEFDGEPIPVLIRGRVHHYEGTVRRVTG